jgi:membrane fusion protein, multidrug efflux system
MIKRMVIMLAAVGLLFGGIFGYHAYKARMMKKSMATFQLPPATVTAMRAEYQSWQAQLKSVGSLRAVRGVDVTSEVSGLVQRVLFKSGDDAKAKQVLVQLNADSDIAHLRSLEAQAALAKTVYERDRKQFEAQAISQATLDADASDLRDKNAQVTEQAALVEKKTICAPFAGRLGISTVNPGQFVNPGDNVVTLQTLDPIYADFFLPQQELSRISLRQAVVASTDTYPGRSFRGRITAINPKVDTATRNVQVEATVANSGNKLLPGMYVSVEVKAGAAQRYLTLPQTAVTFNPYGETVFVVEEGGKGPGGKPALTVRQAFVTTGPTRGDQIAVLKGIKEGDMVVTSGQLKLKNGSRVVIDNKVVPSDEASPAPKDE